MATITDQSQTLSNAKLEHIQMYYEHQFDRMGKLDEQRLTITGLVISLSVLSFTFGYTDLTSLNWITGFIIPAILILSNVIAIGYIIVAGSYCLIHRKRAKLILQTYSNYLLEDINKKVKEPWWSGKLDLWQIQITIHIILVILVSIPILMFLFQSVTVLIQQLITGVLL